MEDWYNLIGFGVFQNSITPTLHQNIDWRIR
jgi:hypothetical protein